MANPIDVIQSTLSPVFLVSGSALFLNFLQARLSRVRDLLRAGIIGEREHPEKARDLLLRSRVLHHAVILAVLSIAFTMGTALSLLFPLLVSDQLAGQGALWTFAAALVTLAASTILTVYDTLVAADILHAHVPRHR